MSALIAVVCPHAFPAECVRGYHIWLFAFCPASGLQDGTARLGGNALSGATQWPHPELQGLFLPITFLIMHMMSKIDIDMTTKHVSHLSNIIVYFLT